MLRSLYYSLPPQYRFWARRFFYLPIDIWEKITGKRSALVPPRGLIYTGSGDYVAQGNHFLKIFVEKGDLKAHHRVLDVGSGIGRMALPLTTFLRDTEGGTYEGFDVIEMGVQWCQRNISAAYPHFRFRYVPLVNDLYRNDGAAATDFRFPYTEGGFDFVFLTSVFTHMQPDEVAHYLAEIARVMDTNGTCLATFFVLTADAKMRSEKRPFSFPHIYEGYALMDAQVKAANVAYDPEWLEAAAAKAGLCIEKLYAGYWSGLNKAECVDFQDVVIFKKTK